MINQIYPCLWFDGQARAAADFYCTLFNNSKIIADSPILTKFELNKNKFMALNGGSKYKINPSISFSISCDSLEETNNLWNQLMDRGKELMPIDRYEWSERFGCLQDRFGLSWQLSLNKRPVKQKIKPCLIFANKNWGRTEEAINFYSSIFDHSSTDLLIHYYVNGNHTKKVFYSEFTLNHLQLIAMDSQNEHNYSFNDAVSFVVECQSPKEIEFLRKKLTDGGQESISGWLKDRFGVSWQVVPAILGKLMENPKRADGLTKKLIKVKKNESTAHLNF